MKKNLRIIVFFSVLFMAACLAAQTPDKPLSVGIFVYTGVEILDFSGPSEVFGSTQGFQPFIVAYTKEPVVSQGFITVTPQYSIDDCPPTDILVFPGGATGEMMDKEKLIEWIKERAKTTQIMMSVCTGAGLLSKAGLLDGKEVTTFHGFIPELQKITPRATVLSNTRFVDNGQVVTTAGVSAGTDGALHVVAKIKGEATAKATAFYMEYDKWEPKAGKINETTFIRDVGNVGLQAALTKNQPGAGSISPLYYPGELTDLADKLLDSKPAESEAIFRLLLKKTVPTPALYDGLGQALAKSGKIAPPDSRSFQDKLMVGDLASAKDIYQKAIKSEPDWLLFTEEDLNATAYELLRNKKSKAAHDVFQWVTELYPASPNAWDSLSEYYESAGEKAKAIAASETCLAKITASDYSDHRKSMFLKISNERIERLKQKP